MRRRVVLLHGIGVGAAYMRPLATSLDEQFDVVVPVLPGWRGAPRPDHALDLVELGEALVPQLPAAIVANSMGCQVAVELAIRRPELVESLVLVGPTVDPRMRPLPRLVVGVFRDWAREPPSLWWIIARDYLAMGPGRFARTAQLAYEHHIEERLPLVEQPTLIVRGERDGIVTQGWCEYAAGILPRGRLVVVPRHAHAVHYSAPLRVAQEVEQHLRDG